MVAIGSDRVRGLGKYAAVRAEDADAEQLPFEDRSFDVVVANHVLYHTNPARAVPELARVLRDEGLLVASTNGPCDHVVELSELSAAVFGDASASEALEVFSSVTGEPIVKGSFGNVERRNYEDELWCTDPNEVVVFITSTRPGEQASPTQFDQLRSAVQSRFDAGAGVYMLSKKAVVFLCRSPHRERP
jgi:SAM-dependent methyltransferase